MGISHQLFWRGSPGKCCEASEHNMSGGVGSWNLNSTAWLTVALLLKNSVTLEAFKVLA